MSLTGCAPEHIAPTLQDEPEQPRPERASRVLKTLLLGFAGTVSIALALAGWYVSGRIFASDEIPLRPGVSAGLPALPGAGLYLEAASIGAQDTTLIQSLEANGYHARVEAGPNQGVARILIGPFTDRSELEKAQRKLGASGILAMESAH